MKATWNKDTQKLIIGNVVEQDTSHYSYKPNLGIPSDNRIEFFNSRYHVYSATFGYIGSRLNLLEARSLLSEVNSGKEE